MVLPGVAQGLHLAEYGGAGWITNELAMASRTMSANSAIGSTAPHAAPVFSDLRGARRAHLALDGTLKTLQKPRLGTEAYSGTKHDRGHLAPNQAHSGHVCGAGQTFTMANMAPQFGPLNQGLWADLEAQVLFWAVTEGPIYVLTGTTFTTFPTAKFQVITSGGVDKSILVKTNEKLRPTPGASWGRS